MSLKATIFLPAMGVLLIVFVSAAKAHAHSAEPFSANPANLELVEVPVIELMDNVTSIEEDKQLFQLTEPCAIITCNRANPFCCKGYHCSIQLFLFGGLGFCHYNQPHRPTQPTTAAPPAHAAPAPANPAAHPAVTAPAVAEHGTGHGRSDYE